MNPNRLPPRLPPSAFILHPLSFRRMYSTKRALSRSKAAASIRLSHIVVPSAAEPHQHDRRPDELIVVAEMFVFRLLDVEHAEFDPARAKLIGKGPLQSFARIGFHVQAEGAADGGMEAIDDQLVLRRCGRRRRRGGRAAATQVLGNQSGDAHGDQRRSEGENRLNLMVGATGCWGRHVHPVYHVSAARRVLRQLWIRGWAKVCVSYIQFTMFRRRKPRGLRSARPTLIGASVNGTH